MTQLTGSILNPASAPARVAMWSHCRKLGRVSVHTVACCVLALIGGCERPTEPTAESTVNPEIAWAAAALARNPDLDVLATDSAAGIFTVRIKSTGEVRTLQLAELAAAPISQLAPKPALAASPDIESATRAVAANTGTTASAVQAPAAPATTSPVQPATLSPSDSTPASASSASAEPATGYTIDRAGGQVKVSGPGVSIVSSGSGSASAAAASEAKNIEPIICEGKRLLHLDNRVIHALGDGVIARGGCELYITNSRVVASGTAVTVHDAVVHIANSTIEGNAASVDADDSAHLLVRSSTFKGMQRRSERATIQDQGGNQWR